MIARRYNPPPVARPPAPEPQPPAAPPEPLAERNATIRRLAHNGTPRKRLALIFGLCPARISQICRGAV